MSITKYTPEDLSEELRRVFGKELATATVRLRFTSDLVGGQPASEKGVRAFAEHHLKLTGEPLDEAVQRILTGEVRKDSNGDEVREIETYGLNVLRRTEAGCAYVGTWQVRAMLKQSASRLGLFSQKGKVGSKGDLAEAMAVRPDDISKLAGFQEICIIGEDGKPYTARKYKKFMGSVTNAGGRMSIVHDSEIAPPGARIAFTLVWPAKKIKGDDMAAVFALGQNVGLGSVKSLECGRFEIEKFEVQQDD